MTNGRVPGADIPRRRSALSPNASAHGPPALRML